MEQPQFEDMRIFCFKQVRKCRYFWQQSFITNCSFVTVCLGEEAIRFYFRLCSPFTNVFSTC